MKQALKNEVDMLDLINKIQAQLIVLDKKMDTLINRPLQGAKPSPTPPNKGRMTYAAICADCKKECTIPFKPSGDRPVYCQDCFSRRKVITMSRIGLDDKPKVIDVQEPQAKTKKKAVTVKKPIGKKKTVPKKK